MGLNPEVFIRNKRERKHRDYGSQYSRIYSYCTLHSSSYCLFTYNLRKKITNGKIFSCLYHYFDINVTRSKIIKKIASKTDDFLFQLYTIKH